MRIFKIACCRQWTQYVSLVFFILAMNPMSIGQDLSNGSIVELCQQLNGEYTTKTAARDYTKITKIYQILERSFKSATPHEQEMIIKTIRKGFRFASPPGASKDFRCQGAECLMSMGIDGLKALLFTLENKKVELTGVDKLIKILGEAYKKGAPFEEEKIATIYDIFQTIYEDMVLSDKMKILKSLERAFHIKTQDKEGEFKIAAASHLAILDTMGLQNLLNGVQSHRAAGLSYPKTKWDRVVKPLRVVLYAEYDRKRKCDEEKVILIFNIFTVLYGEISKSEQKSVTAYMVKASRALPLPDKQACLVTAANSLSTMGKFGLAALEYLLNSRNIEGIWKVVQAVIVAMGRTKDPSALDSLTQLLWDDYPVKINAACTALSHFSSMPLKARKAIVKDIIKVYAGLYTKGTAKSISNVDAERYHAVRGSMNMVLSKLTNQQFNSAPQWQKWFNDNKGKPRW